MKKNVTKVTYLRQCKKRLTFIWFQFLHGAFFCSFDNIETEVLFSLLRKKL